MEWQLAMLLLLGTVCVAMFTGLPVALAFFAGKCRRHGPIHKW